MKVRKKLPFEVDEKTGSRLLAAEIEKAPVKAYVPKWPWLPLGLSNESFATENCEQAWLSVHNKFQNKKHLERCFFYLFINNLNNRHKCKIQMNDTNTRFGFFLHAEYVVIPI